MTARESFSVEERAARFQRRYTGPWTTATRTVGPVAVTHRYRRRARIEAVGLSVAVHDLQRALERDVLVPILRAIARALG